MAVAAAARTAIHMTVAPERAAGDKIPKHALAACWLDVEQAGGLQQRQAESRHLVELRSNASAERVFVSSAAGFRTDAENSVFMTMAPVGSPPNGATAVPFGIGEWPHTVDGAMVTGMHFSPPVRTFPLLRCTSYGAVPNSGFETCALPRPPLSISLQRPQ